jgi:hypothetical protein
LKLIVVTLQTPCDSKHKQGEQEANTNGEAISRIMPSAVALHRELRITHPTPIGKIASLELMIDLARG